VELADGGTLFLDEIGELGISVQAKLLRFVQERTFERIGGVQTINANVRLICATNRELQQTVREGRFREDLFYRISVFPVTVPALRGRKEDIEPLVNFFVERFRRELGRPKLQVSAAAMKLMHAYDWPGNIRELENCIERAAILCDDGVIAPADLSITVSGDDSRLREIFDLSGTLSEVTERAAQQVERVKIEEALATTDSRQAAADLLGINHRTLLNKIKLYGLEQVEEES
jgi:DNA-binding NtrC family response regulator